MPEPAVERSLSQSNLRLHCRCGWEGLDAEIDEWDIQNDRGRAVRRCPCCGEAAPEWGTLFPLDGVAKVARGPLKDAIAEAGYLD